MILVDPIGHMVSTEGPEELHKFAARVCLDRAWYQESGRAARHPHYDLTTPRIRHRVGQQYSNVREVSPRTLARWAWWSRADRVGLVLAALGRWRLELGNEAVLQGQIAQVLETEGVPYLREPWLSGKDRIDFLAGPVGIEVKVKGGPTEIERQCARYCATGRIKALVLATSRRIGLPGELHGVPCRELVLSRAWL